MSDAGFQFRTAAFGGFHKKDVLNYIEGANRVHGEKLEVLQRELADAVKAKAALEERSASAARREATLTAQVEQLTENMAVRGRALEEGKAELERDRLRTTELEALLSQFREKLSRTEPAAEAYENVKDRTAGIELEAHHRAKAVETQAQERVGKIRAELEQWVYKVQAGYDRLRTDVDATVSHASGELERVRHSLETLTGEFGDHDTALEALLRCCQEEEGKGEARTPPAPLPLEEE